MPKTGKKETPAVATKTKIFVVDDEQMIGEVVQAILELEGYDVTFFANPEDAVQAFKDAHPKPQLILTDFLMSPINGMELISLCKRNHPKLHTILYSGNVGEEIMEHYTHKPDGFFSKPFLPNTMIDLVNKVLKH